MVLRRCLLETIWSGSLEKSRADRKLRPPFQDPMLRASTDDLSVSQSVS